MTPAVPHRNPAQRWRWARHCFYSVVVDVFPAFFPLSGARVVIAGDGWGAAAKARLFSTTPAEIGRIEGCAALDPASYTGAALIFLASENEDFLRAATLAARASGAPVNVVDHPELSDFHTPAIIDRGAVVAAIGTAGAAPLMAAHFRAEIERRVPAGAGRLAELLGARRAALRRAFPDLPGRRAFLRSVLSGPASAAADAGDLALAAARLDTAIGAGLVAAGRVSLIAAPQSEDLISLRAARALSAADVVAASPADAGLLAAHARRDAELLVAESCDVVTLCELAQAGRLVAMIAHDIDQALVHTLRSERVEVEIHLPAPLG